MPDPVWPASLPQNPYAYGESEYSAEEDQIRTPMDAGIDKARPKYSVTPEEFPVEMVLSKAQLATLMTFYVDTLKRVYPFEWIDFTTGDPATYRFKKRPKRSYFAGDGDFWRVNILLEVLP